MRGDVLDPASVEAAVRGQDAVVCALGHKRWFYPNRILSDGTRNLIRAMESQGVRRLVCETSLGIGDTWGRMGLYYTLFVGVFILPFYFFDKLRQERLIRGELSRLDHRAPGRADQRAEARPPSSWAGRRPLAVDGAHLAGGRGRLHAGPAHRRHLSAPRAGGVVVGAALLGVLMLGSPVASPPPAVEGHFPGSGGTRLFYRKVGTAPKVVVFLHGGPGSNFRGADAAIEPLAGPGRSVVLYDQRGGGLSDLETIPALLTAQHHVRDLEALRVHLGVPRMTLVGLSWGAGLAALYTAEHPRRVERLVLVSPMAPVKTPFWNERLAKMSALRGEAASARRAEMLAKLPNATDEETRRAVPRAA